MASFGEILPRLLKARGIDMAFGIPGVHTVEFYRGLPESGLTHVTPRHEQGAGFMADGYARVTGRPAACLVISGPGVTNIATAMGQAYGDSIPMLVISSVHARGELGRGEGRLHELKDQSALAAGVAAFSRTVMDPEALEPALDAAVAVFRGGRPRPVHIEIPLDVLVAGAPEPRATAAVPTPPSPDPAAVAKAARMLDGATAPLFVLGGGASDGAEAARALAEALGAPVVPTINAKGILPPGHPLLVGSLLPEAPVRDALAGADVVLALGTELGETDTLLFGGRPTVRGELIRVDIDPGQIARNVPAALGIVSDSGAFCAALTARLTRTHDGAGRAAALRDQVRPALDPAYLAHGRILDRLAATFPGLIVAGNSCQPVYGGNLTYDARAPRSWFNSSTGFGTLGYGLPAAMGAKIARPDAPVVALIGDGGAQFTLPEIATAVEAKLSLPILLWNNRGYGEIKTYMRAQDIPEIGVDIHTPDFAVLAAGFGAEAVAAKTPRDLIAALKAAFVAGRPTLIEIDEASARDW